ncbi:hypothetical protein ACFQLX_23650 [Streptomyces polyrhachis]|uniref:Lipoprotein n=1 Tax=Streptomyces polyrhachis TaxID=1282885 RepID=A0ABW2GNP7_9ACTN
MRLALRPALRAAALVLTAALLAACTDAAEPRDTSRPAPAPRTAAPAAAHSLTAKLRFPLDRYGITDADQRLLERARDRLAADCMRRHGLTYVPSRPAKPAGVGPYTYLYGVDDPVLAAEYGYTDPRALDPKAGVPPRERELTADEELVLHGDQDLAPAEVPRTLEAAEAMKGPRFAGREVPVLGCYGDAVLRVNRPRADWVDPTVLTELAEEAALEANGDPRVKSLLAEWSRCMAAHGHRTKSPLTAREELGLVGDARLKEAVEAAVHDVACKKETRLIPRWSAVDADYQRRLIADQRELLDRYDKQHRERTARARAVLSR